MGRLLRLRQGWRADLLALLAGAALPLAFAPLEWMPLAVFAPAALLLALAGAERARALWRGWLFGLGQFGVGVWWVFVAIHVYGYTAAPIAALMTALFIAFLGLFPALTLWLYAWSRRRLALPEAGPLALLLLFPALWTAVELFRAWFLTGFPWLALGFSQTDSPLAGWAPLFGVYGLTLLCAVSAGALVWIYRSRGRNGALATALLIVIWGGGALLQQVSWTHPVGKALEVAIVQGNVPQETKWDPEGIRERLARYRDLTLSQLGKVDLVVWPENAITVFYRSLEDEYFAPLQLRVALTHTVIVGGVPLMNMKGEGYYTTLFKMDGQSKVQFYRKRHLVPFGEYLPLSGLLHGLVNFFDLPMSSFIPGPAKQPLFDIKGHKAAATVCYEDTFASELTGELPRANFLINGSNNAWYGDSWAAPQHLQMARMLAIVSAKPLVGATTNGISALVDYRGETLQRSQRFVSAVLKGAITGRAGATPFSKYGNAPVTLLVVLLLLMLLGRVYLGQGRGQPNV